ncbi:pyrroloquinoline quinone biosynthesis protein PqqE [Methyloligella sp. 2.7D]|uniref:pyrroloquinoline quinone biosynthesis protein PqqE n=1 Tax=unclassified Methyloligella TaxID=2625955 RepID=UPI00157C3E2E|nr:pyrroloquinoline quinone biosynthesis protein PqqE [Methyloligella sp. GL2]QKP77330.1 pyrroloquinoline quinone biosynthesis protein PqqE [Methyloligella sp. GL2]
MTDELKQNGHFESVTVDDEPTAGIEANDESAGILCARAPIGLLAELTHRCPLQCGYCSNPIELERVNAELTTEQWISVMEQAGEMGILQIHLSGGEPTARKDLEDIVEAAAKAGLYTNLITAAVTLKRERLEKLKALGLDHVQISFQDVDAENAERIGGYPGATAKKLEVARWVTDMGLPLTINAPIHRQNIHNVGRYIDLAVDLGAQRLEIAHVQYYGWAFLNRASLIPTYEQTMQSVDVVEAARERLKGVLTIDMVVPDYYAKRPKPCMGGWAKGFMNITPAGKVMPCHAAESIPQLTFDNAKDRPLLDIWLHSDAFNAFRGTDWMKEPCRSCAFKEIDWGGCRCQAMAMTGDPTNTDPACSLSPYHREMVAVAREESHQPVKPYVYRNPKNAAQTLKAKKEDAELTPAE